MKKLGGSVPGLEGSASRFRNTFGAGRASRSLLRADELVAVAAACAEQVVHPSSTGCCGFAGDRGFLFPELTASATRAEAADVRAANCDDHVSANRMCEVAMSSATGRPYRSVLHLLEEATRPQ